MAVALNVRRPHGDANRDVALFEAIARALGDNADPPFALERTLEILTRSLELAAGWVWLFDRDTERFYLAASWQLPPYLQAPVQMTGSNCWCFESFLDGDFASTNVDVIECSRLRKAAHAGEADLTAGLKYHASVALRAGDRQLGIMNLSGPNWSALSDSDLRLLSAVGAHVGMAVDRAQLAERAAQLARTEERTRLARDIHDTLAQDLTGIALHLESALRRLDPGAHDTRAPIEKALGVARSALGEARSSVLSLRSDPLGGKPLTAALAALTRTFTSETGVIAAFHDRSIRPLAHAVEVELFWIATEALTNVRRHARARRVEVALESDAGEARMFVDDDGTGVATAETGRYGIVGMRERAESFGGTVEIAARAAGGTRVAVRVPVAG